MTLKVFFFQIECFRAFLNHQLPDMFCEFSGISVVCEIGTEKVRGQTYSAVGKHFEIASGKALEVTFVNSVKKSSFIRILI